MGSIGSDVQGEDYTATLTIDRPPEAVFDAITDPRRWWSEDIEGDTDRLGAVFYYHFKDIHRGTFQVTELVPGARVTWHVLQNYFNFVSDSTEWTGTDIRFELAGDGDTTELTFTHVGLRPAEECYDVCFDSWNFYLKTSLHNLLATGAGEPNRRERNLNRRSCRRPSDRRRRWWEVYEDGQGGGREVLAAAAQRRAYAPGGSPTADVNCRVKCAASK